MATNFPVTGLDSLTNPAASDKLNSPSHSSQHANANDAIEAIEAKVGVDSSAVTTSHDYKLSGVTGSDKAASRAGSETLTTKTINLTSNTLSGTTAQFNTALSDNDFATLAGSEVLTNKTIALSSNTASGTLAQFNTAVTDANLASLAGSEALTNKTIALGSNTVSGTRAEFNTAMTDDDFASLTGTETLTNKTLTAPVISTISNTGTLTLPTSTDTLVGKATTDVLTNKTLTTPTIASFTNATHTHANAAGGGQIALTTGVTGTLPIANGGTAATTIEVWIRPQNIASNFAAYGKHVEFAIGNTVSMYFGWSVPQNFTALIAADIIGIADTTETIQFDLAVQAAAIGQQFDNRADSIVDQTKATTANQFWSQSILTGLDGLTLAANDQLGIELTSNTDFLYITGLRIRYT